jgi:hypothetical protein
MRTRIQFQRAALAIGLFGSAATLAADQPIRFQNIRIKETPVQLALTSCYDGSPTCRNLIDTIESSTTIVIVRLGYCKTVTATLASCLHFMADTPGFRYLRITLDPALHGDVLTKMLAHELQHAVEILRAPEVTDHVSLRALYERIGYRSDTYGSNYVWETADARRTTEVVQDELRQARKVSLQARRGEVK